MYRHNHPLQERSYPYVSMWMVSIRAATAAESSKMLAILVVIAVNDDGYYEVQGDTEGMEEDKASWSASSNGSTNVIWIGLNLSLMTRVLVCWRL